MSGIVKKIAAVACLAFLGLWLVALVGGFALPSPREPAPPVATANFEYVSQNVGRRQLANNLGVLGLAREPVRGVLDRADLDKVQVHEKIGRLSTSTTEFDADEAALRAALDEQKAVVTNESSKGVAPERRLTIEVGVSPDKFDALVARLQKIGRPESSSVEQLDRTGELRQLAARRQSLKKHQETVNKLSTRDNNTDDSLKLAREAKEIERDLEALSAQAGDFLGKESYYTVSVTLAEDSAGRHGLTLTLARRAGQASLWAAAWWGAAILASGSSAAAFVSVRVLAGR